MAIETLAARTGATPLRIRQVQNITLTLPFIAGIVNFLTALRQRRREAIAPTWALAPPSSVCSHFRSPTASRNCPPVFCRIAGTTDCAGRRLIFWSAMQALTGMVNSFSHLFCWRIRLGIGKAPFMPAGVKSINDWYAQRSAARRWIFDSSTVLGYRPAGPGRSSGQPDQRTMFVVIGSAGIVVGLCWYVG